MLFVFLNVLETLFSNEAHLADTGMALLYCTSYNVSGTEQSLFQQLYL